MQIEHKLRFWFIQALLAGLVFFSAALADEFCFLTRAAEYAKKVSSEEYAHFAGLNHIQTSPGKRPNGITRKLVKVVYEYKIGREVVTDPKAMAELEAMDSMPQGTSKRVKERIYDYFNPNGKRITNKQLIAQLNDLKVPPAHADEGVWISPDRNSHVQAVSIDGGNKPQYQYHPRWVEIKASAKFRRIAGLALALPTIRQRVNKDFGGGSLSKDKVIATIVRILDLRAIRIGNEEFAESNETYGVTTLKKEHVTINGNRIVLDFTAKSSKRQLVELNDAQVATVIKQLMELKGEDLFQFTAENGGTSKINSAQVNDYIRDAAHGLAFTAKDFRTWLATAEAARALMTTGPPASETVANELRLEVAKSVSTILNNTPVIALESYIFPEVFNLHRGRQELFQAKGPEGLQLAEHERLAYRLLAAGLPQ